MSDSVFTKIINGEIPSHKVYEDDLTFAFLTIEPTQPGQVLVIPKKQIDQLWDLSDEDYQAVMATAKKIAKKMRDALAVKRVGVRIIGEEVPHAHVHLIPFNTVEDFYQKTYTASDAELAEMAAKLAF